MPTIMEVDITNIYYTIPALFLFFSEIHPTGAGVASGASTFTKSTAQAPFASHSCTGTDTMMAVIHSEEEAANVLTFMKAQNIPKAYIGLKYKEDNYFWADYTPFYYSNFAFGSGSHHEIICQGNSSTLKCDGTKRIRFVYAHYGRTSTKACSTNAYDQPSPGSCVNFDTYGTIKSACGNTDTCGLTADSGTFPSTSCSSPDKQYIEVVYECLDTALNAESCVYMNGTTGKWHQVACTESMDAICETYTAPNAALNCSDYAGTSTSVLKCPADQPVPVGCICPCSIYVVDKDNRQCQCMCSSNATITATCCSRRPVSVDNPGYDRNPTMACRYTSASSSPATCASTKKALGCTGASAKDMAKCEQGGAMASWCCETTFGNATVDNMFADAAGMEGSDKVDITAVTSLTDCYKKCIEDQWCLAVVLTATDICEKYRTLAVSGTATPNLKRRLFPLHTSNMLSDYSSVVSTMSLYVRRLDGIAVGNITYETCLESCSEEDNCEQVDWRNDGVCYASYASSTDNNCRLLTSASYQTTTSDDLRDALKYGLILDCYWIQKLNAVSCETGYAVTSCSCSTDGLQAFSPTGSDTTSCTCTPSTGNSSAAVQCCRYYKTSPRLCPPGQEMNMTTATCKPCPVGLISTGFGSVCKLCPGGYVTNVGGGSKCTPCMKDYIPNANGSMCEKCPMGHYNNHNASHECIPVDCGAPPPVMYSNVTVNTTTFASVASYRCDPGYQMANATSFLICGCYGNWTGQNFTCEDIDECESSPCVNNGTCNNMVNAYNCTCLPGYTGFNCETDIDECESVPCLNGGSCMDQVNAFKCECVAGYTGINCETDIDECDSSPCMNSGTCVDQVNSFMCQCATGYTGSQCETDIDECDSTPCQNFGTCTQGTPGTYSCQCAEGYTGFNCETDIDECASAPCTNGGSCTDQVNSFICQCVQGYTGINCETNIDECASSPCMHTGTCVDQINAFMCQCATGYTGSQCETDMDECDSTPCQNSGTCIQGTPGTYSCNCGVGFTGFNCETDIDYCQSSPCTNYGTCQDDLDDFSCDCVSTYTGKICDIKIVSGVCKANSSAEQLLTGAVQTVQHEKMTQHSCINHCNMYTLKYSATTGGNTCTCGSILNPNAVNTTCSTACAGAAGGTSQSDMCGGASGAANLVIADVVAKTTYPNPIGCYPTPTTGSADLDMIFPDSPASNFSFEDCKRSCGAMDFKYFCINPSKCTCLKAIPTSGKLDDAMCTMNCPDDNTKKCGSSDNNKVYVYGAAVLSANIDPCQSNPCQFNGTCSNYTLSNGAPFYNCTCEPGYNGINCENNINECASQPCQNGGSCTDKVNMYECSCLTGYNGTHCEIIHDCMTPKTIMNGTRTFTNTTFRNNVTYACDSGFFMGNSSDGKAMCTVQGWTYPPLNCYSIDECANVTCHNGGSCIDGHLNFTCECQCPYSGRNCETVVDCGAAPNITFGSRNFTGNSSYGSLVTYACDDGYKMVNGTGLKMCNCKNSWVGDNVGCEEINECLSNPCQHGGSCTDLINMYNCTCPAGSTGINCETNLDDCVGVDCGPGTCVDALNNYTCACPATYTGPKCGTPVINVPPGPINVTGTILQANPRSNVECEQASLFPNTSLLNDGVVAGTTLNYKCTGQGTAFPDTTGSDPTRRQCYCTGEGKWSPSPIGCQVVKCPVLALPAGTLRDTEDRTFGIPVTYMCRPGLTFPDGSKLRSLFCEADGKWSSTVAPCVRQACPAINTFTNARVVHFYQGDNLNPARVMLRCSAWQYFPNGAPERNVTCTTEGKWTPSDLNCNFRCIPPPWDPNAPKTIMTTTDKNADILVSCRPGFRYPDGTTTKTLTCGADLQWDMNTDSCEEKVCPIVPSVGGATPSSNVALVGHNVTYSCSKFDWFLSLRHPNATIYCFIANVSWSQAPENCSEIHCGAKENVANANFDNSIADTPEKVVTYTCTGSKRFLDGKEAKNATCTFWGNWTRIGDSCDDNRCPHPKIPRYSIPTTIVANLGAKVNFTCEGGYTFPDNTMSKLITCKAGLTWDSVAPDCKPIICPVLHNISSLSVSTQNHTYGAEVNVSCARAHKFADGSTEPHKTVTCLKTSEWSKPISSTICELIRCEKPRVAQYTWPYPVKDVVYESVTYYCKTGFNFKLGEWYRDITCQVNGTWTDETVKEGCSVITCPFKTWYYGTWNTSNFVVFSSVNYTCPVNQTFKDRAALKISTCQIDSKWYPPLETCYDLNSDVFQVEPTDAKGADTIGIVSAIFVSVIFGLIVSLDLGPLCAKAVMKLK